MCLLSVVIHTHTHCIPAIDREQQAGEQTTMLTWREADQTKWVTTTIGQSDIGQKPANTIDISSRVFQASVKLTNTNLYLQRWRPYIVRWISSVTHLKLVFALRLNESIGVVDMLSSGSGSRWRRLGSMGGFRRIAALLSRGYQIKCSDKRDCCSKHNVFGWVESLYKFQFHVHANFNCHSSDQQDRQIRQSFAASLLLAWCHTDH